MDDTVERGALRSVPVRVERVERAEEGDAIDGREQALPESVLAEAAHRVREEPRVRPQEGQNAGLARQKRSVVGYERGHSGRVRQLGDAEEALRRPLPHSCGASSSGVAQPGADRRHGACPRRPPCARPRPRPPRLTPRPPLTRPSVRQRRHARVPQGLRPRDARSGCRHDERRARCQHAAPQELHGGVKDVARLPREDRSVDGRDVRDELLGEGTRRALRDERRLEVREVQAELREALAEGEVREHRGVQVVAHGADKAVGGLERASGHVHARRPRTATLLLARRRICTVRGLRSKHARARAPRLVDDGALLGGGVAG